MKRAVIPYTTEELDWIKENRAMTRRDGHAAFCERFNRSDVSLNNYVGLCKRKGWRTGRDGRIQPGNVPLNKGKKMPFNAASAATQFKKGQRPVNTKFAGHERMHKDGYLYISIEERNPHTGFERRYVLKHKHFWEKKNGLIPKGMCLKCIDGDRTNTDPSNWELIPRGALPLLSGRWDGLAYDKAVPEVKPAMLTLAKLRATLKKKKR